jgi:vancomycin resistance protein YoaR
VTIANPKARWIPAGVMLLAVLGGVVVVSRPEVKEQVLATYSTPLEGRMRSQRHNAALSFERLDGAVIGPHEVFSFNRTVGTWSRDRGYRKAPVSYNGQLVESWGGGVCQASTTLYNAALLSGMKIIERHPHRFAPGYVPPGRDAAVAFDRIDLRFANPYPFSVKIHAEIRNERLVVQLTGAGKAAPVVLQEEIRQKREPKEVVMRGGTSGRVRNSGKAGYEVLVWRRVGKERELVSSNDYPAMHRIVEFR